MKIFSSQSLRTKVVILISLVTIIFLGAFQSYTFFILQKQLLSELNKLGTTKAIRLARELEIPMWEMDETLIKNIILSEYENEKVHGIYVTDNENINIHVDRHNTPEVIDQADKNLIPMSQAIFHNGNKIGNINLYLTTEYLKERVYKELTNTIVLTSLEIGIIILLLWIMMRRIIIRPIDSLVEYTTQIADGDYSNLNLKLDKDEIGELGNSINQMKKKIELREKDFIKQNEELRKAEEKYIIKQEELHFQANHDALTGLPNRLLFSDRVVQSIEKAKRKRLKFALLFIDLDHFKEINDSLGHDVGDEILKTVTSRLLASKRAGDTLARLGGDEFTIILEDLEQTEDASSVANKILESLSQSMNVNDNVLYVSSSIGISIYPNDGQSYQSLLKFADSAMYKAKGEGRNNFQYYNTTLTELAFERVVMEASLRAGIKNNELVVYYQPQVNGTTDTIIGMEALVRWNHPTMGLVSPAKFIPLAESTGLIVELDQYVMKTAMTQITQWYREGLTPGVLAINLAVQQLQKEDFITMFKELIEEINCKPEWIELEVTEGQIMTHPEEAIIILQTLSDLGIELAIDDFGTGYSSLAYLKKLPIDKLKIDQAFIKDLPNDEEDVGISKAVIALAKSLNLNIIAEGVETKEQRDFLIVNGCENIQGYFYSKPVPPNELKNILKNGL